MSKVKKIGILTFGKGINVIINILFMPYMARALDYELYGTYGQAILIVTFVSSIIAFGLPQILNVYLSDSNHSPKDVLSSSIIGSCVIGLISFFILFLISPDLSSFLNNNILAKYIQIYSLTLILSVANNLFFTFLIYNGHVKTGTLIIVVSNAIKILLVILSIQIYQSLNLAFWGIVISTLIQFLISFITTRQHIGKVNLLLFKEQLKNGFPLGISAFVGITIIYTDSIMVSKVLGVKEYAIYRNGAIEVPFISTLYLSISSIVLPEVSQLIQKRDYKKVIELKKLVVRNSIMIIYPIMFYLIFFSQEFIIFYLGEKYTASSIVFLIFCLSLLVRVNDFHDILISLKKSKYILYTSLLVVFLNFGLNLILIKYYGIYGAAMASIISILVLAWLQIRTSFKLINYKWFKIIPGKKVTILIVSILLVIIPLKLFLDTFSEMTVVLKLILSSVIYFTSIFIIVIKKGLISKEILNKILPGKIKF